MLCLMACELGVVETETTNTSRLLVQTVQWWLGRELWTKIICTASRCYRLPYWAVANFRYWPAFFWITTLCGYTLPHLLCGLNTRYAAVNEAVRGEWGWIH